MADDNPFGDEFQSAPAPAVGAAIPEDVFVAAEPAVASPAANGGAAAPLELVEEASAPAPAESAEDAFFTAYTPPAPAPEPTPVAPAAVDPRIQWRKQNEELLKKREAEEAAAKGQVLNKAKEHLTKFYEVRNTTLAQRKANNRKKETVVRESEVPTTGTSWEKINALVNFATTTGHTKDVARYKSVLINCKSSNVAIRA